MQWMLAAKVQVSDLSCGSPIVTNWRWEILSKAKFWSAPAFQPLRARLATAEVQVAVSAERECASCSFGPFTVKVFGIDTALEVDLIVAKCTAEVRHIPPSPCRLSTLYRHC